MRISIENRSPALIVKADGALTGETSGNLEREVLAAVPQGVSEVVLNLSELEYVSSSGIGAVVRLFQALKDRGCNLTIDSAPDRIRTLFDLAGVTALVPFRGRESGPP